METTATLDAPLFAKSAPPRGNETVLLVEDDEVVLRVTRMILEDLGYRVLSAEDGTRAAALSKGFEGDIDLVLSDVMLPDGDGVEWSERLSRERPKMKTLLMSAYKREALRREGIFMHGAFLLQKPFTSTALALHIRQILDQ
ncbi:MAG TPA: response regulator [Candidatus Limnocylindrales bacterium]|nr:response regulator [Candidatus Limnocylindrales bacterium]